jgi:hypothetical protein
MDVQTDSALMAVEVWDAVRAANRGDQEALSMVERMLYGPEASVLLSVAGALSYQALEATLTMRLGEDQDGTKSILRARIAQLRNELGWAEASNLERLAIERVVLGWLAVHCAEIRLAQYGDWPSTARIALHLPSTSRIGLTRQRNDTVRHCVRWQISARAMGPRRYECKS